LKRELAGVSAQDDFARWAKLRRQHDKAVQEFEKIGMAPLSQPPISLLRKLLHTTSICQPVSFTDATLRTSQTHFTTTITTLRWLSTTGLRYAINFSYTKRALFWLPAGWVPGYVEWILSFPRAPKGSVSINIWDVACASVIALVGEAVGAVWVLATRKEVDEGKAERMQGGKVAMPARVEEKKEL
jgi:hypothetical protein